ncbi:MAG: B3/4 domain-containing protein [Bacillota bacterium]|nr:B3/4 domain-containing protein [Bacillota bacterium]
MKKFIIEEPIFEIFPDVKIGVLVCRGIDNTVKDENKYADYLAEAQKLAQEHIKEPEFTQNPVVRTWRDGFYKFKTKKGARCSIEALLKRVAKGGDIGTILPLVDLYNGLSLKYGVPIGGEDIDAMDGDIRLTVAEGGEDFVTYGSDKSEPPYEGEVVYKDNAGAICRCFNWREAVRTMLQDHTKNAFMIIESIDEAGAIAMEKALDELKTLIETELGGTCERFIVDKSNPEIVIEG